MHQSRHDQVKDQHMLFPLHPAQLHPQPCSVQSAPQAVTGLLSAAAGAAQAVMYCKTKAARIHTRLLALVPALGLLRTALLQHATTAAARQQEHLQTLNDSLLCLLKVHNRVSSKHRHQ
jgi:hypothetical protein